MAVVQLKNLTKRFRNVAAVRDLSLEIRNKEFLTLLGPSGCGKTTTLNMIAGLEQPTSGEIWLDGQPITHVPAAKRDIAMVFQTYALYPHMTVFDNMAFALKIRHVPKPEIQQRVEKAASILGLEKLLGRRPRQLSGGQRQRVALGRAIVRNPKVFLLDEPLSNLDAILRVQMRAELKILFNQLQATVVYVTHDQAEAMTMSDRIAIFRDGELQQVDTPLAIYNRPVNRFVAGFVGSPPMNFLEVRLDNQDGRWWLTSPVGLSLNATDALRDIDARSYLGKQITLGLRPEDLRLTANGAPGMLGAEVQVVEQLGSRSLLYLKAGDWLFSVEAPSDVHPTTGATATVAIDPGRIYLFDDSTGRAIRTPPVASHAD